MSLTTNYPCLQIVFHAANLTLLLPAGRTLHSQTTIPHGRSRAIYGQILSGDRPLIFVPDVVAIFWEAIHTYGVRQYAMIIGTNNNTKDIHSYLVTL